MNNAEERTGTSSTIGYKQNRRYSPSSRGEKPWQLTKFDLKQGGSGQFMFNLKAGNGEVILTSELYKQKQSAIVGVDSLKADAGDDTRYERKTAKNGQAFFVLMATNGQIIGKSEMYSSASAMENGIQSAKKNGPVATIQDTTKEPKSLAA
jgi:uncharacterized protein